MLFYQQTKYSSITDILSFAIQTLQAHVAVWRWQIWPKACFRQYSCDIVDKNVGDYWQAQFLWRGESYFEAIAHHNGNQDRYQP